MGGTGNLDLQQWLAADETAKTMLARVLTRRTPSLTTVPPLDRVQLHAGHVLEIVGPSGSAKSELLLQAAVTCILPKQWDGVVYGGSEGVVMMFDLDCRFDMLRLVNVLQLRINEARGHSEVQRKHEFPVHMRTGIAVKEGTSEGNSQQKDELFMACLKRFLYVRCYSSFDFLAALKTLRVKIKRLAEDGMHLQFLMIDSIGAFYWLDRAVSSLLSSGPRAARTALSLQVVSEAVVQELNQLLQTHPVLILATKSLIYSMTLKDRKSADKSRGNFPEENVDQNLEGFNERTSPKEERVLHREYMPAVWQGFVSHRLNLQGPFQSGSAERSHKNYGENIPFFTAEWKTPYIKQVDKFIVQDSGIKLAAGK